MKTKDKKSDSRDKKIDIQSAKQLTEEQLKKVAGGQISFRTVATRQTLRK